MSYTYDTDFRPASQTVGGSSGAPDTVTYGHDADSLLTQAGEAKMVYDPVNGLLTQTTVGNIVTTTAYNDFGEPRRMTTTGPAGLVYDLELGRDNLGRITSKRETTASGVTEEV